MPAPPSPAGVYAAALTPLTADLAIDHDRLVAHARWLLNGGCHGLVLFGTTGEATSFSVPERQAALDALLDAGVAPEQLLVGTGCTAITDTLALTRHAVHHGVSGVLVLPPFYYKRPADAGLFDAYAHLIAHVDAPFRLYLYHIPGLSMVPISDALVAQLRTAFPDVVVGFKDSSNDWDHMRTLQATFPALDVFAGNDRFLTDILAINGAGCIASTLNVTFALARRVYDQRMGAGAAAAQDKIIAVRNAFEAVPTLPALKFVMAHHTGHPGWSRLRPPLRPLDEAAGRQLLAHLDALNFTLPPLA